MVLHAVFRNSYLPAMTSKQTSTFDVEDVLLKLELDEKISLLSGSVI